MKIYTQILIITTLFLIVSCNNKNENFNENKKNAGNSYSMNLVKQKNQSFALDEVSTFSPYTIQYLNNGEEYLLTSNENTLSIDVYSFTENKKIHTININDSNTRYLNNIGGFWAKNTDSIFVYTRYKMSPVLLTLDNWEVLNKEIIPMTTPEDHNSFFNHASNTASPSFVLDDKIHFKEFPMLDIASLIGTGYSYEVIYDLTNKTSHRGNVTWPEEYNKNTWKSLNFYYWTFDEYKRILYSWPASHNLMIRDGDSIYNVTAKSDTFTDKIIYNPSDFDAYEIDFNEVVLDHYNQILYDKYRNVYYRFAQHGNAKFKLDGTPNGYLDAVHSIVILDENFKKIGEKYLEQYEFHPQEIFVGKEGLYISNHNTKNYETLGEDIMSFSLFKLVN